MPKVSRPSNYDKNVFINCPFDDLYEPLFHAIIFTLYDMGFNPKCAKDVSNAGQVRFTKIQDLIENCKYSIHDISRTQLDPINALPRFNMPLELGLDLGCRRYGTSHLQEKVILVLDVELYRYQKFISDIAGQDIDEHRSGEENVITVVRDWLRPELDPKLVKTPNGANIYTRYRAFQAMLPSICTDLGWDINKLPFIDFSWAVYDWIRKNPIK
ncbi:MAG: hypothetical protein ABR556_02085 [Pyrinomonadaceae bacterium]